MTSYHLIVTTRAGDNGVYNSALFGHFLSGVDAVMSVGVFVTGQNLSPVATDPCRPAASGQPHPALELFAIQSRVGRLGFELNYKRK